MIIALPPQTLEFLIVVSGRDTDIGAGPEPQGRRTCASRHENGYAWSMIGFGILLLILAVLVEDLAVLWGIGLLCIVIGLVLAVLGALGHAIGGRRDYY